MIFLEYVRTAWRIISRNKVRSFLTMLGIIIGVMSVIVIMSVGAGAQSLILNQVKSLGSNLVGVLPGKSDDNGPPAAVFGIVVTTLTYDDARAVAESGDPHIVAVNPYVRGADTVTTADNKTDTSFVGVSAEYLNVEDAKVANGRFFSDEEEKSLARVAVLASGTATDLFGDNNPIGKQIKIKRSPFTVIGVMKERGTSGFQNQDDQVFVPVTTAQKILLGINHITFLRAKIDEAKNVDASITHIKEILRDRHSITNPDNDDFSVRSSNQGLEVLTAITGALKLFLALIAAISLIVGGIGIMNIMLAAVEERTREIGLRKALGATSRQITLQFLVETVLITFVGGAIGILLGSLISIGVASAATHAGYSWELVISASSIITACLVSVGLGLIFGISPARRASHLSPMEALRYE